jgi:hypothetical protein
MFRHQLGQLPALRLPGVEHLPLHEFGVRHSLLQLRDGHVELLGQEERELVFRFS